MQRPPARTGAAAHGAQFERVAGHVRRQSLRLRPHHQRGLLLVLNEAMNPKPKMALVFRCQAVPLLMGQYETRKEATPRRFVVNSLNQMVHAGLSGLSDGVAVDGVRRWADASFELYLTILNDQDDATLKSLSLEGLAHFLAVDIKDDEWRRVGQALIDLLLRRRPEETISRSIRSFLTAMAAHQEDVFGLDVVPQLLHHMDRGDAELKASLMKTICHLPLGPAMLERVVSRLVDVLTADSGDDQVRVGALRALTELCRTQETWFAQQVDIFRRLHAWALAAVRANDTVRCPEMVEASSLLLRSLASRLKPRWVDPFLFP